MTARIVHAGTREPNHRELWSETPYPAQGYRGDIQPQLWERVAESKPRNRSLRMAKLRIVLHSALANPMNADRERGPLASGNPLAKSGVIRAGVRVK